LEQSGFYFTTGTDSEVVITMLNNAVGAAPGNDLALGDIHLEWSNSFGYGAKQQQYRSNCLR
jgi:hypothetical protein